MPATASVSISGWNQWAALGNSGSEKRRNPYTPIFDITPASSTVRLTPATPSRKRTPSERTQLALTPSWKPGSPIWNRAASATASPKVATLNASASQRARPCAPRGRHSSTSAPARGRKTVEVSSTGSGSPPSSRCPQHEEGQQQHGAAEHPHRVGSNEAGLQAAAAPAGGTDLARHAVDGAVDHALVHRPGKPADQRAPELDREQLVQLVDVQLAGQHPPGRRVALAQRQPLHPPAAVEIPGDPHPQEGDRRGDHAQRGGAERGRRALRRGAEQWLQEVLDAAALAGEGAEQPPGDQ